MAVFGFEIEAWPGCTNNCPCGGDLTWANYTASRNLAPVTANTVEATNVICQVIALTDTQGCIFYPSSTNDVRGRPFVVDEGGGITFGTDVIVAPDFSGNFSATRMSDEVISYAYGSNSGGVDLRALRIVGNAITEIGDATNHEFISENNMATAPFDNDETFIITTTPTGDGLYADTADVAGVEVTYGDGDSLVSGSNINRSVTTNISSGLVFSAYRIGMNTQLDSRLIAQASGVPIIINSLNDIAGSSADVSVLAAKKITNGLALLAYEALSPNTEHVIVITENTGVLGKGTPVQLDAVNINYMDLAVMESGYAMAGTVRASSGGIYTQVIGMDGTALTPYTPYATTVSGAFSFISLASFGANKVAIAYCHNSDNNNIKIIIARP